MGDERAETYLRLVAEDEFRRVTRPHISMPTSDIAASVLWNLHRVGRILIAPAALDEELVYRLGNEIETAVTIRSRRFVGRAGVVIRMFEPFQGPVPANPAAAGPMRIMPVRQAFRLASERAPADLHFSTPRLTRSRCW